LKDKKQQERQEAMPPDVSQRAIKLRDVTSKTGIHEVLDGFRRIPQAPYKDRMSNLDIYEMNLSVRASNGLMRAGIHTFGKLDSLIKSENGILSVRNLGVKSVKEIGDAFIAECYNRLIPYEKAEFWQSVIDLNE
jgi:DNA-directed RNA polymerase alpha subunit